ncbi:MAG: phytoene desaturase [Myxococcales bacterium]|jgi:phytoene desaturase
MMTQKRAAVVGSGFGGLSVAIRLQTAGFQTMLYEKADKPGGRAYVYHVPYDPSSGGGSAATTSREGGPRAGFSGRGEGSRDLSPGRAQHDEKVGFTFDAGPTVITAPHCLEELFSEAGRDMKDYVELLPVSPFYRLVWDDGDSFDYTGDSEQMLAQIRNRNPEDAEGYTRFVEYARQVFEKGYLELAAQPFLRFSDMVKVAPQLAKLRADRSVYSTVARFVKDPHLREALSFHTLLVGGNPFETSSIYTLIHYLERQWGVFFPRGGTGALVQAMVKLFEELGGELKLDSPVERIDIVQNGHAVHHVTTPSGTEPFDLVVSNADLHHTYKQLFSGEPAAQKTARKLENMEWSMGLFVLYFGTDRQYRDQIAHHTVVFGPRYEELLRDIFRGSKLPDDFSLYLHAPTVTDPSLAPEGCDSFYVLSPVPHLGNAPLDWDKIAPEYADRILGSLEKLMPDLRKHVVTRHWRTPQFFRDELNSYHGSAFSCAPRLTQSAWFRPHNRDPRIPGLYIVGAGTHPGAGVPGVVNSAKATAKVILEDFAA